MSFELLRGHGAAEGGSVGDDPAYDAFAVFTFVVVLQLQEVGAFVLFNIHADGLAGVHFFHFSGGADRSVDGQAPAAAAFAAAGADGSGHSFQLGDVDGVSVVHAGCHAGDAAGDFIFGVTDSDCGRCRRPDAGFFVFRKFVCLPGGHVITVRGFGAAAGDGTGTDRDAAIGLYGGIVAQHECVIDVDAAVIADDIRIIAADDVGITDRARVVAAHGVAGADGDAVAAGDGGLLADGNGVLAAFADGHFAADGDGVLSTFCNFSTDAHRGAVGRAGFGEAADRQRAAAGGFGIRAHGDGADDVVFVDAFVEVVSVSCRTMVFIFCILIGRNACHHAVAEGDGAFAVGVGSQADGGAVGAVRAGDAAHGQGTFAFGMGIAPDGDAADVAVGDGVAGFVSADFCGPEYVFSAGINVDADAGGGAVSDSQSAFAQGVGVDAHGGAVHAVGAGGAAEGERAVAFGVGVGAHGDAAHVDLIVANNDFFVTRNVAFTVSCKRRGMVFAGRGVVGDDGVVF